ncbi:hypothetical protein [Streptomyces coeruleorubidus]|uniref:Uncharacterized protein n=1 Tax=Streptomyces coeruleorubidus TaxID=116188 RepID=A0ABZ0KFF7_STRC4|nr:hypothetical protein [Streptomyces coeruleorubidus]WOT36745.1 hypothetical protein R5U08_22625 [Streptomyces coeruleorubidus]
MAELVAGEVHADGRPAEAGDGGRVCAGAAADVEAGASVAGAEQVAEGGVDTADVVAAAGR